MIFVHRAIANTAGVSQNNSGLFIGSYAAALAKANNGYLRSVGRFKLTSDDPRVSERPFK